MGQLSGVQLYLIEAEVFIKRPDEVFMKQVAAAGRVLGPGKHFSFGTVNLSCFYLNNLSTHPLKGHDFHGICSESRGEGSVVLLTSTDARRTLCSLC